MLPDELEPDAGSFPLGEQKNRSDEQVELVEDVLKAQQDEQKEQGDDHKEVAHNSYCGDTVELALGIKRLQQQLKGSING